MMPPPTAVIMPRVMTPTMSRCTVRTAVNAPFNANANVPARSNTKSTGGSDIARVYRNRRQQEGDGLVGSHRWLSQLNPLLSIIERIKEQIGAFPHGGMGQRRIADLLVRQFADHRHLQRGNDLAGIVAE